METIESLNIKLYLLREKWKIFPKSYMEPNWWKFKCDKTLAERYKNQIKILESGEKIPIELMEDDDLKDVFK